ncbi:uncharacterized protein KY384_008361 [Bacidia gigantensis]|uniref:uncharacterized protein n=1 Tax=Bacidia gigantensis TaxID=2732470 RepID=UPI001D0390BB|nr:uncharacterized protein KY384_008361 [Bacidia gigantensis]KAG8526932.1 hypothetical protein KY384_008361 [Bacidia gigantensis]
MTHVGTTQLKRAARVILVGAPGVGKGTQAERLMKRFPQLTAVSSGDLLRNAVNKRSPLGQEAQSHMKSGSLVPDNMILQLILSELQAKDWVSSESSVSDSEPARPSDSPSASFILDGFPRTSLQASRLDTLIPVNLVVSLITPINIIIGRIADRWVHAPSGRVYNTGFNKPKLEGKDDITGEPLTRREDDNEDTWKTRLKKFGETSEPLLEHYDKKGLLWTVQGNSSDEISPKLFTEFEDRFCC